MAPALSLRLRLTLLWTMVSLLVLLGLEVLTLALLNAQLNGTVDRDLTLEARDYQQTVAGAASVEDLKSRAKTYLARQSEPADVPAAFYRIQLADETLSNSKDRGLLETMTAARPRPGQPTTVHDPTHGDLRVAVIPIDQDGRPVGDLRIALPLRGVQSIVGDLMLPLLLANVALIGLAGLLAYVVIQRALAPVRRITATAAGIDEDDLNRRIGYQGPADEVGNLAATFDEMLSRLQSGFEHRQSFYALASHELRTPLTIVRGHLEVLRRSEQPAAQEVRETLDLALDELRRVSGEVDDMLLLGRMLLGQRGRLEAVDAASLVADVHRKAKGLAVRAWRLDTPEPVPVDADAEQLERALLNLVTNAVRHTAEGERVTLACHRADGWARLEVVDSGEGIPAGDVPHVFDPWYRGGKRDRDVGGLGLTIVREVVRAHRGHIEVASHEGGGTTFTVRLPLALPAPTEIAGT